MRVDIKCHIGDFHIKEGDWVIYRDNISNIFNITNSTPSGDIELQGKAILVAIKDNVTYKVGYKYYETIVKHCYYTVSLIDKLQVEGYLEDIFINPKVGDTCRIIDIDIYYKYGLTFRDDVGVILKEIKGNDFLFRHPRIDKIIRCKRNQFVNSSGYDKRREFKLFPSTYKI